MAYSVVDVVTQGEDLVYTWGVGVRSNQEDHEGRIVQNEADIATNASDISSNDTDIATNAGNISSNDTDIATNAGNISSNDIDIATNVSDISDHETRVTTLEGHQIGYEINDVQAGASNAVNAAGVVLINISLNSAIKFIEIQSSIAVDTSASNVDFQGSDGEYYIVHSGSSVISGAYSPNGGWNTNSDVDSVNDNATIATRKIAAVDPSVSYIEITTYGGPSGNLVITAYGADVDDVHARCTVKVWI